MIQKFVCPKCGNTNEVPVEGFEVGRTEVDCTCGASMVPSGGLMMETEEPPHRDRLRQKREKIFWVWQFVAIFLLISMLALFLWAL